MCCDFIEGSVPFDSDHRADCPRIYIDGNRYP